MNLTTEMAVEDAVDNLLIINIIVPIICLIIFAAVLAVLYHIDDPGLKKKKLIYDKVEICDPDDVENTLPKNVLMKLKKMSADNAADSLTGHMAADNHNHTVTCVSPGTTTPHNESRRRTYSDTTSPAENHRPHHRQRTNSETQRYLEGMLRRPSSTRHVGKTHERARSKSASDTTTERKTDFNRIEEEEDVVLATAASSERRQSETAANNIRMNNATIS